MKRLSEQAVLEGIDRELAELLRAARPLAPDAFMKRRILTRLNGHRELRKPRRWAGTKALTGLLGAGVAAAAASHHYRTQNAQHSRNEARTTAAPTAEAKTEQDKKLASRDAARPRSWGTDE